MSLAVGQDLHEEQRVVLFVKMAPGQALTDELRDRIRKTLRTKASPRHVPALILEAPEIPYTLNMKKVESAVTNILNGRPVANQDSLSNPSSLDYFREVAQGLRE
jgi:acetoacetyl-CoA synthetase